jgi:Flp pilus assembly protein TadD
MAAAPELCPDDALAKLAQLAEGDTRKGLRRADTLLASHPRDPRLHFLKGSLLAALQAYPDAVAPMRQALEIAPDYHIARFQLGLLLLSSGLADQAAEAWAPLSGLDAGEPLRLFAEGLQHMARDEFAAAERLIGDGLARNTAYPAVNADMQLVLDRIRDVAGGAGGDENSQAHWLLQVAAAKPTKH